MQVKYHKSSRDYGHIHTMSIEIQIKKYMWRAGISSFSTFFDARVENIMKEKLLNRFWRHIGAA